MAGKTTHEQQLRIIEKREDTSNAGKDFDAAEELRRTKQERQAREDEAGLRARQRDLIDKDDRHMIRGENQESPHHKRSGQP